MPESPNEKSCWTCAFHDLENDTFLGRCNYFKTKGFPPKDIPPDIVDQSCKLYQAKQA